MFAKLPPLIEKTATEAEAERRKANRELTEACAGVSIGGYARYGTDRNRTVTGLQDHSLMSVWRLFLLEVAAGVYYLPGLNDSCSSAHQPKGKSE